MTTIRMNYRTFKELERQGELIAPIPHSYNPDMKTIDVEAPERFLDNYTGDYIGSCFTPDNIYLY